MPEIAFDSARLASLYALGLVAAFAVGAVAVHVVLSVIASRRARGRRPLACGLDADDAQGAADACSW